MNNNREKGGCGGVVTFFILFMIIRGYTGCVDDTDNISNIIDDSDGIEVTGPISNSLEWVDSEHPEKKYTATITLNTEDYYSSKKNKESYWLYDRNGNPDEYKLRNSKNAFLFLKEAFVWNKDVSSYTYDDVRWDSYYLKTTGLKVGYSYMKSYLYDKSRLDYLYSVFNKIQAAENLNRNEFADMIVSFVQHIEYSLPMSESCDLREEIYGEWALEHPCDSYVPFGYYSPNEFIGKWTGDCDTRSVFLFTVLKHYGYDVVILISDLYSHAILGVNLTPQTISNPLYKSHNRKKYYVWEATYEVPLGILDPSCNNMYFWDVALDNNLNSYIKDL